MTSLKNSGEVGKILVLVQQKEHLILQIKEWIKQIDLVLVNSKIDQ